MDIVLFASLCFGLSSRGQFRHAGTPSVEVREVAVWSVSKSTTAADVGDDASFLDEPAFGDGGKEGTAEAARTVQLALSASAANGKMSSFTATPSIAGAAAICTVGGGRNVLNFMRCWAAPKSPAVRMY